MKKMRGMRDKILFTVLILILFRLGSVLPVPFINTEMLRMSMNSANGTLFDLFNMMSGGGLMNASVFAMGVSPYINASIIVQLLTVALPVLENLKKEGAEGQRKINKLNRYVAFVLAAVQSYSFYMMLSQWGVVTVQGFAPLAIIMLSFMAGSFLVMWLGERITEKGIGNGISIILVAGILSGLPEGIVVLTRLDPKYWIPIVLAVILAAIVLIIFMSEAEKRVPVSYSRAVAVDRHYNMGDSNVPLKVNMSGVMPIIFASTILSIPNTIKMFVPSITNHEIVAKVMRLFDNTSFSYGIIYFVLIILFNFFYVSIQYDPVEMANTIKQQGGVVPGIRPGKPTAEYLKKSMSRLTFIGAIFLGIIAVVPIALNAQFQNVSFYLGGTSLLIIVGVAIETAKQIEANKSVYEYSSLI